MAANGSTKPGWGKLLDAWDAPPDAGEPIGCLATSYTFSPGFFEEECLARFLRIESDPRHDGPLYLVEREEKSAGLIAAAALVDAQHCRGSRSLRWDLLPARLPGGVLHAKVSLLVWQNVVRLIVASANLTEDGYRRNQEIFGALDWRAGGDAPRDVLDDLLAFLRDAIRYADAGTDSPAVARWNALLDRAAHVPDDWCGDDTRSTVRVRAVLVGPNRPDAFARLREIWPDGSPPDRAVIVSPFFDPPEAPNAPAAAIWRLLRQRGQASATFVATAEPIEGEEDAFLVHAPRSLLDATPKGGRAVTASVGFVELETGRPLHAKVMAITNDRWVAYVVGSSNFTSPGTGLSASPNLEANLAWFVDRIADKKSHQALRAAFPPAVEIANLDRVRWMSPPNDDDENLPEVAALPAAFGAATFEVVDGRPRVLLVLVGKPPAGWALGAESDGRRVYGEDEWIAARRLGIIMLDWPDPRPPSGFLVRWDGTTATAWWPVNVASPSALPPPDELRGLTLDALIDILTSARPLHRVLADYLKRRAERGGTDGIQALIDPHKHVDTSGFLLQRTRRLSWALAALKERLERPALTADALEWRLRGPCGVTALAERIGAEAKSDEERAFLLAELARTLQRVSPQEAPGSLSASRVKEDVRTLVDAIREQMPRGALAGVKNLRGYVAAVFGEVSA